MKWGSSELLPWIITGVALLAIILYQLARLHRQRIRQIADTAAWTRLASGWNVERARRRVIIWWLAFSIALVALARPQWGFHWEKLHRRGLDIMVLLDTSRSMLAEDVKPDRLQQAKWGIRDLVHKLSGDRIGLISFAGSSFLQCPLTADYAAFLMTLDDVYAGIIPRGGTAIGQALRKAVAKFNQHSNSDRVIILVTDGEDNQDDPTALIPDLRKAGIRVYAIGIGSTEGELIPIVDKNGHTGFLKDRAGNVVRSRLREDVLKQLALSTGGAYVHAAPGDFGLDRIYDQGIAHLKRGSKETRMVRIYADRFGWFLAVAFLLFALEAVIGERKSVGGAESKIAGESGGAAK